MSLSAQSIRSHDVSITYVSNADINGSASNGNKTVLIKWNKTCKQFSWLSRNTDNVGVWAAKGLPRASCRKKTATVYCCIIISSNRWSSIGRKKRTSNKASAAVKTEDIQERNSIRTLSTNNTSVRNNSPYGSTHVRVLGAVTAQHVLVLTVGYSKQRKSEEDDSSEASEHDDYRRVR